MDRLLNTKSEKQSIYEIFRACRLCGAGGGYKMPIIQSIPLDIEEDVELRQKIRECVQIEVHQNDKMPPLICELCVDKINDFYEFLEMCRQTNKKTRLRLGLPPQTLPHGASDAGDCILGVTEPVYLNEDSNDMPLSKQKVKIKIEKTEKSKKGEVGPRLKRKVSPPPEEPKGILTRRSVKVAAFALATHYTLPPPLDKLFPPEQRTTHW
ncbi:hypothetical protein EVAR_39654_1 [Eumeta japonica]|uniref:ZAD domain-containing protein n=1 Tax=Eumeta variegata TaxID=151549 RepID=A0A4C1WIZ3_EUMVA|nr:hypothetical protein EVAR_39654_1 [Eumeta japonica]